MERGCGSYRAVTALFSEYPGNKKRRERYSLRKHVRITTFWYSFIYYLAVKVMLLAGISSQHKKIPPAKNVMQTTIKQVTKLTVPLNPEKSLNPGITSDAEISTSLRFGYPECVQTRGDCL